MKSILSTLFLALFFVLSVCSQSIDSTLHKAYKYNSKIILDEFFMNWEKDSKLSAEERLKINIKLDSDDTLREVYELANLFYKPIYSEVKYFVIEDTLKYGVCYSDSIKLCNPYPYRNESSFVFYPFNLDIDDGRILYLNSKYNNLLTEYFRSEKTDFEVLAVEYKTKRNIFDGKIQFFCNKISFLEPTGYHKEDLIVPHLWSIVINKNLDKALLSCSPSYYSTETSLWEKVDGSWKFKIAVMYSTY